METMDVTLLGSGYEVRAVRIEEVTNRRVVKSTTFNIGKIIAMDTKSTGDDTYTVNFRLKNNITVSLYLVSRETVERLESGIFGEKVYPIR